jgi:hypothetical protein
MPNKTFLIDDYPQLTSEEAAEFFKFSYAVAKARGAQDPPSFEEAYYQIRRECYSEEYTLRMPFPIGHPLHITKFMDWIRSIRNAT